MSKHLEAALALAGRGLAVFPCGANRKTPITKHGCKEATRDPQVITAWWTSYATANVAVAIGEPSGVVVLDIDMKRGLNGETDLEALEQKHGSLPSTVEAITPSKGRHLWFTGPGRPVPCSRGVLAPGLDIRGDGGYVLVPPSHVVEADYSGNYAWSVDSAATFAPMPAWLLDLASPLRREPKPAGHFADLANGVGNGRRNESLASLCGKLFRVGLTPSQVFDYLLYWNTLNTPPLPEERIKLAVRNIAKREARRTA
jgi:Bifunctional DNA primase/polymerase, N-terminal/Primase C terminal 1 (PriCT-1)